MDPQFKEYLGVALLELYKADRYLYNVAARVRIQPGPTIEEMPEVPGYTDGVKIYFTPAWMASDREDRLNTLTHEVLHIISKHLVRIRNLPNIDHMRMNVAADLSIASQQIELGQNAVIVGLVPNGEQYLGMDMFEIYKLLSPEDGQKDLGHPEVQCQAGDQPDDGDTPNPGSGIPAPTKEEEADIDSAILQAAIQAEAEGYSTAASKAAARQIDLLRGDDIPWYRYLQEAATKLKSDMPTWARPNRRMASQVYLPSRVKKQQFEATMAMDVSGSVGQEALNKIASIAHDILTRYVDKFHLITFDDKIVDEWHLRRRDEIADLQLNGYGGTYVDIVYKHLEDNKCIPKLLIVATDGYIPDTENPGYKVIWLIVDNPTFTCDYGVVLHINSEKIND